jgi:limonene-1,2-epoxide hydrolase
MEPDDIVTAFCNTLNSNLEESLIYISADCVYQNMPFPPVIGPEGVRETLAGFFEVTGHVRIETIKQCSVGNLVMNERVDYFDPPNGKAFGLPVAGAFEISNGKIVAWRDYFCMQQFSKGTGLQF